MRRIIAATDFSSTAENAVHYACNMAMAYNASVTVIHSYIIPVVFNDNPMPVMPLDESKQIAEQNMERHLQQLSVEYPSVSINSHVAYGDITDTLFEFAETTKPWLIIIGNSSNEEGSFWMGSNLLNTFKKQPFTVMAVPPETKFKKVNKIAFACDFKNDAGHMPASELLNLVNITNASLHIINVDHNNKEFSIDTVANLGPFHQALVPATPEYHYIDNENFSEGIQNFVNNNAIDWLVEIPHRHSILDTILHKSHTKEMVLMTHVPLIALHDK